MPVLGLPCAILEYAARVDSVHHEARSIPEALCRPVAGTTGCHSAGAKFESGKRERGGCASRGEILAQDGDEYRPGRNAWVDVERLRGPGNEMVEKRVGWIQLHQVS